MTTDQLTRREFLQVSGMGAGVCGISKLLFPAWMPRLAFRPPGASTERDVMLCIFLRGGMDGLSAVPPVGEGGSYYDARPTQAVQEPGSGRQNALDLDGFFGLHPALSPLHGIYQQGDLAIVHATGSTDPTRSHFDAMLFMEYGQPGNKVIGSGWLGRHLQTAAWENQSPFRAVGLGTMLPTSLAGSPAPLSLKSIADFHLRGREGQLRQMQETLAALYAFQSPIQSLADQAGLAFETLETVQQLQVRDYAPQNGAIYPQDDYGFGLGLQQVAQLIKADVGLEVACIDLGGWDTHEYQGTHDGPFNALLSVLGQGLAAFYADLGARMSEVNVVTMSEFGRRVAENGSQGTDHGHGNVMFLMGGGVQGGQVYGRWPGLSAQALDDGDLAITTDYRNVLAELLTSRVGNPAIAEIFPGLRPDPLGIWQPRF